MAKLADGLVRGEDGVVRCAWGASTPDYHAYHDEEWGRPVTKDRPAVREALPGRVPGRPLLDHHPAQAPGVPARVRPVRLPQGRALRRQAGGGSAAGRGDRAAPRKIESTINNAQRAEELVREYGSLGAFFWSFEPDPRSRPRRMTRAALLPLTQSPESVRLSKELKRRGWTFVGPTTMYALMQAMGLVNDHVEGCAARGETDDERARLARPKPKTR
jgi:DNA-3-methyladenine glycosylase I